MVVRITFAREAGLIVILDDGVGICTLGLVYICVSSATDAIPEDIGGEWGDGGVGGGGRRRDGTRLRAKGGLEVAGGGVVSVCSEWQRD